MYKRWQISDKLPQSIVGKTRGHVRAIYQACSAIFFQWTVLVCPLHTQVLFFCSLLRKLTYKMDDLPTCFWGKFRIIASVLFLCVIFLCVLLFMLFPIMLQSATFRADTKTEKWAGIIPHPKNAQYSKTNCRVDIENIKYINFATKYFWKTFFVPRRRWLRHIHIHSSPGSLPSLYLF